MSTDTLPAAAPASTADTPAPAAPVVAVGWTTPAYRVTPLGNAGRDRLMARAELAAETHDYRAVLDAAGGAAAALRRELRDRKAELLATLPEVAARRAAAESLSAHEAELHRLRGLAASKAAAATEAARAGADPSPYEEAAAQAERRLRTLTPLRADHGAAAREAHGRALEAVRADLAALRQARAAEARRAAAAARERFEGQLAELLTARLIAEMTAEQIDNDRQALDNLTKDLDG